MQINSILITGGAGYIGSQTVLELAKTKKYKLTVFDNLSNGHRESIDQINAHTGAAVKFIKGDLLVDQDMQACFEASQYDAVIHFAGSIEAGMSAAQPIRFYQNNVAASINLFKFMQKFGVKNLVFSSTAAVYGTVRDEQADENTTIAYENVYGESKYFTEQIIRSLAKAEVENDGAINSVILRYFNAAGADPEGVVGQDYPKQTHIIPIALEVAAGIREKFMIYGDDYDTPDGSCIRDYIHVQDLAIGHVQAIEYLQNNPVGSEVFCLGTGKGTSNLEIIKTIEETVGKFKWEVGPRRSGDPAKIVANPAKAAQKLGFVAKHGIKEIIRDAVNWKKVKPQGYEG